MQRIGKFILRGDRVIAIAVGFCKFEPTHLAAFEEREFIAEINWAWENNYDLSKEAENRLWELCPYECYSEMLDGIKSWLWMLRRREARGRIVGALRSRKVLRADRSERICKERKEVSK